jgi:hypothetical protein
VRDNAEINNYVASKPRIGFYLCLLVSAGIDEVSLCVDILVSRVLLLLVAVLSGPGLVVDCGGLQAPMAAITITSATKMFFIN